MPTSDNKTATQPKVSLIVTTRNRVGELDKFLEHLERQTYRNFELLLVDQNSGPEVCDLLNKYSFPYQYFRSNKLGAARGRNVALAIAQGEILAIPDDDCWYPPGLLATVVRWFDEHPDIDMLCVLECNPEGEPMVPQSPPPPGLCTAQPVGLFMERSVWMAQSSMVFLRRKVRDAIGILDESIGVGSDTRYQSGEETDYFLRAMRAGFTMWFEPSIKVFHVELRTPQRQARSNYPYALGTGYVLRQHKCSVPRLLAVVARSFGGALVSALRLKLSQSVLYLRRGLGILEGFFG
jgi:glycosyltransferase involved in cell wall biosynthesis